MLETRNKNELFDLAINNMKKLSTTVFEWVQIYTNIKNEKEKLEIITKINELM